MKSCVLSGMLYISLQHHLGNAGISIFYSGKNAIDPFVIRVNNKCSGNDKILFSI